MMRGLVCAILFVAFSGCAVPAPDRQMKIPAFPGAEGFGADTPGGRGGKVLFVTNLEDYLPGEEAPIPGSLRAAIATKGPRIVIFRVSGTIQLKARLTVREPYLTLAGQTAPGDGICVKGQQMSIATNDVVVRHMRFRVGDEWGRKHNKPFSPDGLGIHGSQWVEGGEKVSPEEKQKLLKDPATPWKFAARDIIVDHCSISWGVDECLAITHADNVTVQWCLVAEGLSRTTHNKRVNHSMGLMVAYTVPHVTLHHNLIMHCNARNPYLQTEYQNYNISDVVNNVVYNWGKHAGIGYVKTNRHGEINFIGNYYIPGLNSRKQPALMMGADARIYARGNICPFRTAPGQDEYLGIWWTGPRKRKGLKAPKRFDAPPVSTQSYREAYKLVLAGAGATLPKRDSLDVRLIRDVRTRKGKHIDHPAEAGGWPGLKSVPPPKDSDNDGMPDAWERRHGLDPNKADAAADVDVDGYTNIEEWLNGTDPKKRQSVAEQ